MLAPATFTFLKNLRNNNEKSWFDANRKDYEQAKADFQQLIAALIKGVASFDQSIINLQLKDCVFRINRDVRFSKDKSPYKTNMGASLNKGGKRINNAGYYFHFEPGKSFVAGGFYAPEPPQLASIRQEIDYNLEEWKGIAEQPELKEYLNNKIISTETLSRPPKGYDASNPAIKWLKQKSFIAARSFTDTAFQQEETFREVMKTFRWMKPMIDFLNRAIE